MVFSLAPITPVEQGGTERFDLGYGLLVGNGQLPIITIPVTGDGYPAYVNGEWVMLNGAPGGGTSFVPVFPLYMSGSQLKLKYSSLLGLNSSSELSIKGGTSGDILTSNGTGEAAFAPLDLNATNITGHLGVANGGTGTSSLPTGVIKSDGVILREAIANVDYVAPGFNVDGGVF